jgi:hypothetical protein
VEVYVCTLKEEHAVIKSDIVLSDALAIEEFYIKSNVPMSPELKASLNTIKASYADDDDVLSIVHALLVKEALVCDIHHDSSGVFAETLFDGIKEEIKGIVND